MLPTERHLQGREHTATVLNWWIRRCGFTHSMLTALAAWVCGDHTWLQGSQLSHLRNGRMRTPQLKLFEGVSAVNEAVATWHLQGAKAAIKAWGPLPAAAPTAALLDEAIWLWHPQMGQEVPLEFHDWCDLFAGRLRLDYVDDAAVSPGQVRLISDRIGEELDQWLAGQGGIRAGLATLIGQYPVDDAVRVSALQQVILGQHSYSAAELDQEMGSLATLFSRLWKRKIEPSRLYAELTAQGGLPASESGRSARR